MQTLQRELASLREQWEAEKLGLSDTQSIRKKLEQAETEFTRLDAEIRSNSLQVSA